MRKEIMVAVFTIVRKPCASPKNDKMSRSEPILVSSRVLRYILFGLSTFTEIKLMALLMARLYPSNTVIKVENMIEKAAEDNM